MVETPTDSAPDRPFVGRALVRVTTGTLQQQCRKLNAWIRRQKRSRVSLEAPRRSCSIARSPVGICLLIFARSAELRRPPEGVDAAPPRQVVRAIEPSASDPVTSLSGDSIEPRRPEIAGRHHRAVIEFNPKLRVIRSDLRHDSRPAPIRRRRIGVRPDSITD